MDQRIKNLPKWAQDAFRELTYKVENLERRAVQSQDRITKDSQHKQDCHDAIRAAIDGDLTLAKALWVAFYGRDDDGE